MSLATATSELCMVEGRRYSHDRLIPFNQEWVHVTPLVSGVPLARHGHTTTSKRPVMLSATWKNSRWALDPGTSMRLFARHQRLTVTYLMDPREPIRSLVPGPKGLRAPLYISLRTSRLAAGVVITGMVSLTALAVRLMNRRR